MVQHQCFFLSFIFDGKHTIFLDCMQGIVCFWSVNNSFLRLSPPEDQAGVIHAISPIWTKLGQIKGLACEQALYSGEQRELFSLRAPKARVSANEVKASEASPR